MALVWCESAQRIRTAATFLRSYYNNGSWNATNGRDGGPALHDDWSVYPLAPAPSGSWFFAHVRFKATQYKLWGLIGPALNATSGVVAANTQAHVCTTAAGEIQVRRNTTVLGTTGVTVYALNTLVSVTFELFIDPSVGSAKVWLNGSSTAAIDVSGVNTQNLGSALWNQINFGHNDNTLYLCDIVVLDAANPSGADPVSAAAIRDARVDAVFVDGAGYSTGWTPGAGNNWEQVDENNPDDDSTYVETATPATVDGYTLGAVPSSGDDIVGVKVAAQGRKTDQGAAAIQAGVRIGGTNYLTDAQDQGLSYHEVYEHHGVSPATSIAWTEAEFNGAELVIDKAT